MFSIMAKKRSSADNRVSTTTAFHMRLNARLRAQLERLAETRASDLSSEVAEAIRERLEKFGFWPESKTNVASSLPGSRA